MSLKSFFIAPPNTSACRGGICRGDPTCPDKHCEGKTLGYEAAMPPALAPQDGGATVDSGIVMYEPDSWSVIRRVLLDGVLICAVVALVAWVAWNVAPVLRFVALY